MSTRQTKRYGSPRFVLTLLAAASALHAPWLIACDQAPNRNRAAASAPGDEAHHDHDHGHEHDGNHRDDRKDSHHADQHGKHHRDDAKHEHQETTRAVEDTPRVGYYLSMHGAKGSDTVVAIDTKGLVGGSAVSGLPADESLHELRGLARAPDGSVLVVNAWMNDTKVLRFGPPGSSGIAPFDSILVRGGSANPAMVHTYGVAVGPDGAVYCSNQDSDTITRYAGAGSAHPGTPLPSPPALAALADCPPGVVIGSTRMIADGIADVRGFAFGPDGLLYVADRGQEHVAVYDPVSGQRTRILAAHDQGLRHPIQIAFSSDGATLFVSDDGADVVWKIDRANGATTRFVSAETVGGPFRAPSALLVEGDRLLVATREGKKVLSIRLSDGAVDAAPFVSGLPDAPEFLLRVP